MVSLYSEEDKFDEVFLSNYAVINLQNPLARIPGVGQVFVRGAGPYSMRVWLDPKKLQDYSITTLDVVSAIQGQNVQVVAGQLGGPPVPPDQTYQFTVNALGRLSDVKQFEDIIIKSPPDPVRPGRPHPGRRPGGAKPADLQQLCRYERPPGRPNRHFHPARRQCPGSRRRVRAAMAEMSKDFPPGLIYASHYDTTKFVDRDHS